jgi:hypothetical protein
MSPRHILLIILYFCLPNQLLSQSFFKLWDKTYGGNSSESYYNEIHSSSSGKLFIVGDSDSEISGDKNLPLCMSGIYTYPDCWIVEIDTAGTILNQFDFGGEKTDMFPKFSLGNNSSDFYLACRSFSDSACDKSEHSRGIPSSDYWICHLDSTGMKIWDKTLGGANYDEFPQIIQLSSGDLIVCGWSFSPIGGDKTVSNFGGQDYWAVKLDVQGSIIWDKVYGGTGSEIGGDANIKPTCLLMPMENSTYVIAGTTDSPASGSVSDSSRGAQDIWLIKLDSAGNRIWDRRYGGAVNEGCTHISKTNDNGFILCGRTNSPAGYDVTDSSKGSWDIWVIKIDSLGNKQWDKRYGGNDADGSCWIGPSLMGGYWIAGYTDSDSSFDVSESTYGGVDYWILKIDSAGNKIWDKRFGGTTDDRATSLVELADSSILLCGISDSSGFTATKTAPSKGGTDYWVVKLKYSGNVQTGIPNLLASNNFNVYPNPATNEIVLNNGELRILQVQIMNLLGEKIKIVECNSRSASINIGDLAHGIYFVELVGENGPAVRRFIKQ